MQNGNLNVVKQIVKFRRVQSSLDEFTAIISSGALWAIFSVANPFSMHKLARLTSEGVNKFEGVFKPCERIRFVCNVCGDLSDNRFNFNSFEYLV